MLAMFNTLVEICLLRSGPQDLPRSASWTVVAALAFAAAFVVQAYIAGVPDNSFVQAALDLTLTAAVTAGLLHWRGLAGRLPQTLLGFFGTGVILNLISAPLARWALDETTAEPVRGLAFAGLIGLLGWNLAIVAHIYRNALKVSFAAGLLIAIVYLVAWMQLNALLFPQPA